MYPFRTAISADSFKRSSTEEYTARVVSQEILMGTLSRKDLKDKVSGKLQIKSGKAADAAEKAELVHLRRQINALPNDLKVCQPI